MVTFDFIGFLDELNPSAYFIKNCKNKGRKKVWNGVWKKHFFLNEPFLKVS